MAAHELAISFARCDLKLHTLLVEMLDEQCQHQTERRGCGYTQATRFLADLINRPSLPQVPGLGLFDALTLRPSPVLRSCYMLCRDAILAHLQLPESLLLFGLIDNLIDPNRSVESPFVVPDEKLKVGSCPLAEKYFLEIAHQRVRRGGRVNVIVDAAGNVSLIEKRGLGDEHSCISVGALRLHGVRLPPGSLLAIDYDDSVLCGAPTLRTLPGHRLELSSIRAGRFLRLTTLAVAPSARKRAFSTHFQQQVEGGLYSPDATTIEQLAAVAKENLQ